MANITEFPFRYDTTIETYADFLKLSWINYTDDAAETPIDFSASSFSGEVLDEEGGSKLFDLTFNTPADDGKVWPQLTDTDTETLTGRTVVYWVKITTGGLLEAYSSGKLTVSDSFKPGV